METALDVLSRAATMVQDNANETRLTAKELPTTKWRRERRMRTGEYTTNASSSSSPCSPGPPGTAAMPVNATSSAGTAAAAATVLPHRVHYYAPTSHTPRYVTTLPYHSQSAAHANSVYLQGAPILLKQQQPPPSLQSSHISPNPSMVILASSSSSSVASLSPSPTASSSASSNSSQTSNLLLAGSNVRVAHRHGLPIIDGDTLECQQQQQQLQHHNHHNDDNDDMDGDDIDDHDNQCIEAPLDMTVSSSLLKQRDSPPPPYREPLPGSTFMTSLALPRPSVITQAPPKLKNDLEHQHHHHHHKISNNHHQQPIDNGVKTKINNNIDSIDHDNDNNNDDDDDDHKKKNNKFKRKDETSSTILMCENVIDEHFRRSLGANYLALFSDDKNQSAMTTIQSLSTTATTTASSSTPITTPAIKTSNYDCDEQPLPLQLTTTTTPTIAPETSAIIPIITTTKTTKPTTTTSESITTTTTTKTEECLDITPSQQKQQHVKSLLDKSDVKRYGKLKTVYLQQQLQIQKEQQQQQQNNVEKEDNEQQQQQQQSKINNLYQQQSLMKLQTNNNNNNKKDEDLQTHALSLECDNKTLNVTATTTSSITNITPLAHVVESSVTATTTTSTTFDETTNKTKDMENMVSDQIVRNNKVMRMMPLTDNKNREPILPLPLVCNKLKTSPSTSTSTSISSIIAPMTTNVTCNTSTILHDKVSSTISSLNPPLVASPTPTIESTTKSSSITSLCEVTDDILASVDDHFAKALGDKWKELQVNKNLSK